MRAASGRAKDHGPDSTGSRTKESEDFGRYWLRSWLNHPALPVLILLLVMSSAIWGFAEIADEVLEGETASLDRALLIALRNPDDLSDPLGPPWLEEMGRDMTALGGIGVLTLTTLGVTGYLLLAQKRRMAVVVLVASLGALAVSSSLKHSIDRPRPDLVPHGSVVYTQSFPSGHSMQSAATYLTLASLLCGLQTRRRNRVYLLGLAVLVTVLVGMSRVYLGVHWPTDVVAGWIAGSAWALACWLLALWLKREGRVEPDVAVLDEPRATGSPCLPMSREKVFGDQPDDNSK